MENKFRLDIPVNNERTLQVYADALDWDVKVITLDEHDNVERIESIKPADFVTMLNWYRYQKENGNNSLTF